MCYYGGKGNLPKQDQCPKPNATTYGVLLIAEMWFPKRIKLSDLTNFSIQKNKNSKNKILIYKHERDNKAALTALRKYSTGCVSS